MLLLSTLFGRFPFIEKLFADSAYQPHFRRCARQNPAAFEIEIVKRSDQAKGFVLLPKRWIVERSIAWLNRCRGLAKDWENLNRTTLAFRVSGLSGSCYESSVMFRELSNRTLNVGLAWAFVWRQTRQRAFVD